MNSRKDIFELLVNKTFQSVATENSLDKSLEGFQNTFSNEILALSHSTCLRGHNCYRFSINEVILDFPSNLKLFEDLSLEQPFHFLRSKDPLHDVFKELISHSMGDNFRTMILKTKNSFAIVFFKESLQTELVKDYFKSLSSVNSAA